MVVYSAHIKSLSGHRLFEARQEIKIQGTSGSPELVLW